MCLVSLCSYAYALEECRERDLAEQVANKTLAMNKKTPIATHALCECSTCETFLSCISIIDAYNS